MSRYSAYKDSCYKTPVIGGLPMGFDINGEKTLSNNVAVSIEPSYAFIQLNSKDRNTATSSTSVFQNEIQPWNNFRVQKPGVILDSFSSRIGISEVRMPWAIPNITSYNNSIYLVMDSHGLQTISIPNGFYSGEEIADKINASIIAKGFLNNPSIAYDSTKHIYTWTVPVSYDLTIYPFSDVSIINFFTQPSLAKTLGMTLTQFGQVFNGVDIVGGITQSLYTSYIDVVSEKLHYNNEVKDGSSARKITTDILCRIMCSDETSSISNWTTGQNPFLIHRQYKTPKMVKWNPDSFIDWFDIQIVDEYGNLVYLPDTSYPDFQLTFLSSEY